MLGTRGVPGILTAERGRLVQALGGRTGRSLGSSFAEGKVGEDVFRVKELSAGR